MASIAFIYLTHDVEPKIVAGATRNVPPQEERNGVKTITVPVEGLNFASCAQSIEKRLGTFSGVREVAASYVTQTATITFDERVMSEATLRELVTRLRLRLWRDV